MEIIDLDIISKCLNDLIIVIEYNLTSGDIIKVSRMNNLYYHYGVYYDNGHVIHLSGEISNSISVSDSSLFRIDSKQHIQLSENKTNIFDKNETHKGCEIEIIPLTDFQYYKSTPIIIERQTQFKNKDKIQNLLGISRYNLLTYNCEHFANYITNDLIKSRQVVQTVIGGTNTISITLTFIYCSSLYMSLAITPVLFGIHYFFYNII